MAKKLKDNEVDALANALVPQDENQGEPSIFDFKENATKMALLFEEAEKLKEEAKDSAKEYKIKIDRLHARAKIYSDRVLGKSSTQQEIAFENSDKAGNGEVPESGKAADYEGEDNSGGERTDFAASEFEHPADDAN